MKNQEIKVYVLVQNGYIPCGIINIEDKIDYQEGTFQYSKEYLNNPNSFSIDPVNLPLKDTLFIAKEHDINGLFSVFRDTLPGGFNKKLIDRIYKENDNNDINLLTFSFSNLFPTLKFHVVGQEEIYTKKDFLQLHNLSMFLDVIDKIENNTKLLEEDYEEFEKYFASYSLGGMRAKTYVRDNDKLFLAKFPEKGDKYNNPRIEYATMLLAKECGINITAVHLIQINNKDIFLIEMYDKEYISNDRFVSKQTISGLTLMQCSESDYRDWDYIKFLQEIEKHTTDNTLHKELFMRIAFNIFCRNTDDHPRNHSVFNENGKLFLTPAYDITPTTKSEGVSLYPTLACGFGTDNRNGTLKNLFSRLILYWRPRRS